MIIRLHDALENAARNGVKGLEDPESADWRTWFSAYFEQSLSQF